MAALRNHQQRRQRDGGGSDGPRHDLTQGLVSDGLPGHLVQGGDLEGVRQGRRGGSDKDKGDTWGAPGGADQGQQGGNKGVREGQEEDTR